MLNFEFIKSKRFIIFLLLFFFSLYASYITFITSARFNNDNSLVLLANAFLTKHIALPINSELPLGDVSDYFHNFYLYFGPFPSIILMPFVKLFGKEFPQVLIGITSLILSFIASYKISRTVKFNITDSLWLSLFLVFSTVLLASGLINITAYQVEVISVPLLLFAIYEYLNKRRFLLIGVFLGLAVFTRIFLLLTLIFFILEFLQKRISKREIVLLLIPVIFLTSLYGLYNQRRFHSFFETGINYSISLKTFPLNSNLSYGMFSPIHIPANLYSLFIMPPEPLLQNNTGFTLKFPFLKVNPWGLAIWYTSPLFLVLFYKFKKNKYTKSLVVTIITLLLPLLMFYSIGFSQYGYRYTLDFLPFLFLLLLFSLKEKLTRIDLALITIGVIFNAVYITSLWSLYPLLGIK
jgi:hypothetical protein